MHTIPLVNMAEFSFLESDEMAAALSWGLFAPPPPRRSVRFSSTHKVDYFELKPSLLDILTSMAGFGTTAPANPRNRQLLRRFLDRSVNALGLRCGDGENTDGGGDGSFYSKRHQSFSRGDAERWRLVASRFGALKEISSFDLDPTEATSLEAFLNAATELSTLFTAEALSALQAATMTPHVWEEGARAYGCGSCGRRAVRVWCVECEACHACECLDGAPLVSQCVNAPVDLAAYYHLQPPQLSTRHRNQVDPR